MLLSAFRFPTATWGWFVITRPASCNFPSHYFLLWEETIPCLHCEPHENGTRWTQEQHHQPPTMELRLQCPMALPRSVLNSSSGCRAIICKINSCDVPKLRIEKDNCVAYFASCLSLTDHAPSTQKSKNMIDNTEDSKEGFSFSFFFFFLAWYVCRKGQSAGWALLRRFGADKSSGCEGKALSWLTTRHVWGEPRLLQKPIITEDGNRI